MALSSRFDFALAFAADLHRHQVRKGSNVPIFITLKSPKKCKIKMTGVSSLFSGESDIALAGVVSVKVPHLADCHY